MQFLTGFITTRNGFDSELGNSPMWINFYVALFGKVIFMFNQTS